MWYHVDRTVCIEKLEVRPAQAHRLGFYAHWQRMRSSMAQSEHGQPTPSDDRSHAHHTGRETAPSAARVRGPSSSREGTSTGPRAACPLRTPRALAPSVRARAARPPAAHAAPPRAPQRTAAGPSAQADGGFVGAAAAAAALLFAPPPAGKSPAARAEDVVAQDREEEEREEEEPRRPLRSRGQPYEGRPRSGCCSWRPRRR